MKPRIVLLGTGSSIPHKCDLRFDTSTLISVNKNLNILMDCGEGAKYNLLRSGFSTNITHILLTHEHYDHIIGLTGLLGMLSLKRTSFHEITIYGSKNALYRAKKLAEFTRTNPKSNNRLSVKYKELEDNKEIKISSVKILPFLTKHRQQNTFGFCITFNENDKFKIVFTGDTRFFSRLCEYVANSDILIANTNFSIKHQELSHKYGHLTVSQAAEIAKNSRVKKLIIQHISNRYVNKKEEIIEEARQIFSETYLGEDLQEI